MGVKHGWIGKAMYCSKCKKYHRLSHSHVKLTFGKYYSIPISKKKIKIGSAFRPTASMARSAVRAGFVIGKKAMRG